MPSEIAFKLLNFIYHTVPASIMDFIALVVGKKMVYRKAYKKTEKILMMMSYFGTREWIFRNENIKRMVDNTKDFKYANGNLDFDLRNIHWNEYFRNYIPGIKRYFFKENCDNMKSLQRSYQWYDEFFGSRTATVNEKFILGWNTFTRQSNI